MEALKEYYRSLGYPESRWHIGPEHPHLEDYAIRLLETLPRARVLEVGYQAGGLYCFRWNWTNASVEIV
jgi:hypothetical protein